MIRIQFPITILKYFSANIKNPVDTSLYVYVLLFRRTFLMRTSIVDLKFKSTAGNISEILYKDVS